MAHLESAPSLREIAERLSVVQRWNGRTTVPWTALQHTILAATLLPEDTSPYLRLVVLMHDAAEGWTGDIPRPYKVPAQAELEKKILGEIYHSIAHASLIPWTNRALTALQYVDDVAALVEAECLCHPEQRHRVVNSHYLEHEADFDLVRKGRDTLWGMLELPRYKAVQLWVKAVESVLAGVTTSQEETI